MNYVFFDIECACVYKSVAKICAFGYVVTDPAFRVLRQEELLVNPKGKFHLTDRKGKQGLVLPYEYEDFQKYPDFSGVYKTIRALLEDCEHVVCGHATLNDVKYLDLETRRYKLPSFGFRFFDTQFFYMNCMKNFSRQYGLQNMATELGVTFTPHRAVDDAYATMRVCEAIMRRENTDLAGFAERYAIQAGKIKDHEILPPSSSGYMRYLSEREERKEAQSRAYEQFYRYVNQNMRRATREGRFKGMAFCFAKDVEADIEVSKKLVAAIFASGGRYTSHPAECNVYIARGEGGVRFQNALSAGAAFVSLDSLQSALELI